jgi:transposase-like protein
MYTITEGNFNPLLHPNKSTVNQLHNLQRKFKDLNNLIHEYSVKLKRPEPHISSYKQPFNKTTIDNKKELFTTLPQLRTATTNFYSSSEREKGQSKRNRNKDMKLSE